MFSRGILIAVALGAMATAASAIEQSPQPSDQESLKIANEWNDAFNKATTSKNANGVADCFTEGGFIARMGGLYAGREAIRQDYLESWKTFTEEPAKIIFARKAPDGSVIVTGTWSGTNRDANGTEHWQGYFTDVLVRDGGAWRATHEIDIDVLP